MPKGTRLLRAERKIRTRAVGPRLERLNPSGTACPAAEQPRGDNRTRVGASAFPHLAGCARQASGVRQTRLRGANKVTQRISARAGSGAPNPWRPLRAPATEQTSTEAAVASPPRSGLRAGPQAPAAGRRAKASQAAASAPHSTKSLTRSPELHGPHGRSHAGVKGDEEGSTPPRLRHARAGPGAWPARSPGLPGATE